MADSRFYRRAGPFSLAQIAEHAGGGVAAGSDPAGSAVRESESDLLDQSQGVFKPSSVPASGHTELSGPEQYSGSALLPVRLCAIAGVSDS